MIIAILVVLGLCAGSFVNALVWRLREQETHAETKNHDKKYLERLSILRGRSMCPHCHHELTARDLIPVLSWLSLGGKCRYCKKPISWQYPLVEVLTASLFVASYILWSVELEGAETLLFSIWLVLLTGLLALVVYDARWKLLPNRIMYPLGIIAGLYALIGVVRAERPLSALVGVILAILVGGGIFYVLFQLSKSKWIGGGDVKLGWVLGLIVGTPSKAFLLIFMASAGGSILSLPLLASGKLKRTSTIPFGPLLIGGAILTVLFGSDIIDWYQQAVLQLG